MINYNYYKISKTKKIRYLKNNQKNKPYTKSVVPLIMANISMLVFALSELEEKEPNTLKEAQLDLAKQYMLVHISNSRVSFHSFVFLWR